MLHLGKMHKVGLHTRVISGPFEFMQRKFCLVEPKSTSGTIIETLF